MIAALKIRTGNKNGVYGEDVEAALRFLFNAMAPKSDPDLPFQGRLEAAYQVGQKPVTLEVIEAVQLLAAGSDAIYGPGAKPCRAGHRRCQSS